MKYNLILWETDDLCTQVKMYLQTAFWLFCWVLFYHHFLCFTLNENLLKVHLSGYRLIYLSGLHLNSSSQAASLLFAKNRTDAKKVWSGMERSGYKECVHVSRGPWDPRGIHRWMRTKLSGLRSTHNHNWWEEMEN